MIDLWLCSHIPQVAAAKITTGRLKDFYEIVLDSPYSLEIYL